MSILAGITGVSHQAVAAVLSADAEGALAEQVQSKLQTIGQSLDTAGARLENLLDVSAAFDAVGVEDASTRKLARVMMAQALANMDMSEELAVSETAGIESEGSDVGLEAFSTIKEYAIKAIEWIQKKWKEFKTFVSKYFNKFFGDVERLKKSWMKILESAKEYQAGHSLEKNAKHEFEKGSDAFFKEDSVVAAGDLAEGVRQYLALAEIIKEKTLGYDVIELEPSALLTDAGAMKSGVSFTNEMKLSAVVNQLEVIAKETVSNKAPVKFVKDGSKQSAAFLGRVRFYICKAGDKAYSGLEGLKAFRFGFGDLTEDQKSKTKVKMDLATASTIEVIADANIELLDSLINIKRNKALDKAEAKIDKASKALDKWKKDAPDADESADKRTAYREGVKIVTEYFSVCRRLLITLPLEFCNQAKMISTMQKDFANKSLSAHSKD
ncbi:hypothetical protein TSMG0013 [Halocynthia phage JM-2012]|uniref:hypothetical protein n=1 Tax=Halocynthia phage JM-2012 TaxID=1173297 RepID=UPI00025C68DC|nr:hypothetical protein TSMG0013 [Halocynthia phage JM-2012]AFI55296.1 hypothetical protein TSMG0013 [Halocynthia phage JM-2012]